MCNTHIYYMHDIKKCVWHGKPKIDERENDIIWISVVSC
jgi:hypothetical protein